MKIKILALVATTLSTFALHAANLDQPKPHFYVQMENRSNHNATISFQKVSGNVSLVPALNDYSNLPAHQQSQKYGVVFNPIGRTDTFNIVFTGKQDCVFNVAFFAINNPKITIAGHGCFGGGYRVNKDTLELYVSDLHLKK